jgi:hypothetical protein
MRWVPDIETCGECGFAWDMAYEEAVATVRDATEMVQRACGGVPSHEHASDLRWSPCEYAWHTR